MTETNYPSATSTPTTSTPEQKPKKSKNALIGVLAAGLLGTWGYFLYDKNQTSSELKKDQTTIETKDTKISGLQHDFDNALVRLDSLTGVNNKLSGDNATLQAKYNNDIAAKKAEIRRILNDKNATAAELAKAKSMIEELNTQITSLQADVARLTGENKELTSANSTLKQEKADLQTSLDTRTSEKAALEKTVDVGSTFSASNIQITPIQEKKNGKEKETTKAKKVNKLVVAFDVENRIAKSGPADLYLIVTAPDGTVFTQSGNTLSTRNDGDKPYTSKIQIDYEQGTRKNVQFPINRDDFKQGDYKIEIYQNGFKIGEGTRSLRKGGLFG
ncbi:MAG: hypothetical protein JST23_11250 [Bacteroidetes bacterium]|nr:hypothetical protein [Bacteroidota bacterium]